MIRKCLAVGIIFLFIGTSMIPTLSSIKAEDIRGDSNAFHLPGKTSSLRCLSSPTWIWAKSAGGSDYDYGCDVAVDIFGNSYITGTYYGSITFDDITLTADFGPQIFVAKLNPMGDCLWAKSTTGMVAIYDQPRIAVDLFMNVYITGGFSPTITFGNITIDGYQGNVFVAKLNTKGDWRWAISAGREGSILGWAIGLDIAVDYLGNTYITGPFMGTITFGKTTLTNPCNPGVPGKKYSDVFIAKVNSRGVWRWAASTTTSSDDTWGFSIAVDLGRNVYITGLFSGTLFFNTINLTSYGESDVFVAKLNPRGIWQWAENAGGVENDHGYSIVVDRTRSIYITGAFSNSATFGDTTLTSPFYTVFVAKLDRNGGWQWAKSAGDAGVAIGLGIAMDLRRNLYITGWFQGTITVGETILTCSGETDAFVANLNSDGSWLWATHAGGTNSTVGRSIAVGLGGNVFITGYFLDTVIFDATTLTSNGQVDLFVAKLR